MRNSFERFNIDHLSPSSLNTWKTAPGIWALRYIAKIKSEGAPRMWRGTAVENGLAALLQQPYGLLDVKVERAKAVAHQNFDLNAEHAEQNGELIGERELIAPMIEQCAKWKAPSKLNATQLKIEYWLDPIPVPIEGWLDFAFDGIDIDLKTTKRCPKLETGPEPSHVGQVSIYRAARGRAGGLLYVSHANHTYFEVTDEMMDGALEDMRATALSLNNFLARMDTKEDVLRSLPVDYGHFQAPKTKVNFEDLLSAG
jgi:hypothetical protein